MRRAISGASVRHITGRCFSSTAALEQLLKGRGFSPERAEVIAVALGTAASNDAERTSLAQGLPISVLEQMEQSMKGVVDFKKPLNCEVRVRVQNENMREFTVMGREGESFVDLVKRGTDLKDYLECACGGNLTCSTCHVYVREPKEVAEAASEEENDMIDLAYEPEEHASRLSCQIKLQPGVKLVVEIPKKAFNYFK